MTTATPLKAHIPAAKFAPEIHSGNVTKAMTAAQAKAAKGEPFMAPVESIRVYDDFNVRVTGTPASEEAMAELVQSIVANGFYTHKPLAVFVATDADANVLYIKDGHRRFEAVERANVILAEMEGREPIAVLPVVASPAGSLEEMMIEMAQSNTGAPLTMYEKGLLAKRLIDSDMAKDDIASRLSMTERHLNNVLLLAQAPAKLRDLIVTDQITSTSALKLMREPKTAATKAAEMVKASQAKGKTKAQPKDAAPKMAKTQTTFDIKSGESIKTLLQAIAADIRAQVKHDSDDNITVDLGSIVVNIATPAPAPAPKPAAPAKKPAAKTPAEAKAAAKAHLGGETPPAPEGGDTPPAQGGEDLSDL